MDLSSKASASLPAGDKQHASIWIESKHQIKNDSFYVGALYRFVLFLF